MAPSSRKKAKTSNVASKNVVFEFLVGLPMDVIFEILGYLDPLDLLHLARTTKALRAILMSRSSLTLWRRVRHAYYQMPDGPEGMSEPQYVSLTFDLICDGCGVSATANTRVFAYWNARLKSCHKCEPALLDNKSDLKKYDLSNILPSWLFVLSHHSPYSSYSLKQARPWSQEYASLSASHTILKEWLWRICEKDELMKKHFRSFWLWTRIQEYFKSIELPRLKKAENNALLLKLEELGWGEELSRMYPCERSRIYYTLLNQEPHQVGNFPQVWSSNSHDILEAIKARQDARIEKEREMMLTSRYAVLQQIYDEYIHRLPSDALIPTIADVALSPPVHAIIADERTDFTVTRQTFESINLMQILPSIVSDWKIRLDDELVWMVQVELSEPFTKDQLLLATTVFYCDACDMDLSYSQVLVHKCSSYHRNPLQCPAWNSSGSIKFNRNVHQAAIGIIDILGLDPKTVTAEDMTVSNRVLQCLDCRATHQGRMTMIWSRAIEHSRKEHNCLPSMISWKVPGHDGQLTLQARIAQAFADLESVLPKFMCGVCRRKETLVELKQHLLLAHGIQNPGEHDILFHPDAIRALLPFSLPETD